MLFFASLAAGLAALAASGPATDPGSTRVAAVDGDVVLTTSTMDGGRYHCANVRGLVSGCPSRRQGVTLIQHRIDGRAPGRLGPLIVAGLAKRGAARVSVQVGDDRRSLRPARFGAYLAVFASTARQRDLVITVRDARGRVIETADYRRSKPRWRPIPGSDRVEHRLVDPVSRRPLGQLVWRAAGGQICQTVGDVVGGRVGSALGRVFTEYPINDGGSCVRFTSGSPVGSSVTVERGRTVLSGIARADVRSLRARFGDEPPIDLPLSRRGAFVHVRAAAARTPVTIFGQLRDGTPFEQDLGTPPAAIPPPAS